MTRCSVPNCDRAHEARGLCRSHYIRLRRYGNPVAGRPVYGMAMGFYREVVLTYERDECLVWPFGKNTNGYGMLWMDGRDSIVSRLVCEEEHGPPPTPKHDAAHSCGKGQFGCVNRHHMSWKTRAENMADKLVHGTSTRGEKHSMVKLTEEQVLAIRQRAQSDLRRGVQREIAKELGVSPATINDIVLGKTWGWL